jgi:hypothetical protein
MATRCDLKGSRMLSELREFGSFRAETQRYICRSLEVASMLDDPAERWSRDSREFESIRIQREVYSLLLKSRSKFPKGDRPVNGEAFLLPLIEATAFDISSGGITSFDEYRFLYERLLGARIGPWLPTAFLAAASLPYFPLVARNYLMATFEGTCSDGRADAEPVYWPCWLGDGEALAA